MLRALLLTVVLLTPAFSWGAEPLPPASERFAKPTVDEVPDMQRHVLPLLGRLGCNSRACHGSFQGKGGFRLSLFGYDFKMDHDSLTTGEQPRVDLKHPTQSLMLEKPTGTEDDHGGGHRLDKDSWQYNLLVKWIASGAPPVAETGAKFVKLDVLPKEIVADKVGLKQPLRVLTHWSDGTVEDVTPLCRFQTNDESIAKVDADGVVTIVGKGDTYIVPFYDNGIAPIPVMLPVSDLAGEKFPQVPTPTKIDELVVQKLKKLGVVPSEPADDAQFLRRVSLDIGGTLPTSEEVTAFVADTSPDKRAKKIDELLERPSYAAWWTTKFCDITGNNPIRQINTHFRDGDSHRWYKWIYQRLADNVPYDELVEGIALARSRTAPDQSFRDYCESMSDQTRNDAHFADRETMPFYWTRNNMRTANEKALSFSYAFLGVRLQCAECHKHPYDKWTQSDFEHFTAFFDRVAYGTNAGDIKTFAELEQSIGVEFNKPGKQAKYRTAMAEGKTVPFKELYVRDAAAVERLRNNEKKKFEVSKASAPRLLGTDELVEDTQDPRETLMAWMRAGDNPYFAKAIVNRVWAGYFGVGIVDPPDDLNLANAPSNPELLDWLAKEFIAHDFDLKWLHRTIANSRTYQLSWKPNETNKFDRRNFSHAMTRRLPAEVVYDAVLLASGDDMDVNRRLADPVGQCTIGLSPGYAPQTNDEGKKLGLFNGSGNAGFALTAFGRPQREVTCDCERSGAATLLQTVYLRNDSDMQVLLNRKGSWLDALRGAQPAEGDTLESVSSLIRADERRMAKAEAAKDTAAADRYRRRLTISKQKLNTLQNGMPGNALLVREAYLRVLGREPDKTELAVGEKHLNESKEQIAGLGELMWALLNTKEFILNH